MNQLYPQGGVIPRSNASYPMANMQGVSSYAAPLNYNQPKEVVSGYDARINPMTGQEIPQTNFAGGGLTSLVNSPYRDSDVMQVKMTPREVAGLQQLAMAYGATPADLYDPVTGQPQFSFLKKILPMIAGAVLPSIPGVGQFAKTIGFGSQALGTSLLVGGVTGLVEGDLKKGLMAGLGAYSGAKISEGLGAAKAAVEKGAEAGTVTTAPPTTLAGQLGLKESELIAPGGFDSKTAFGVDIPDVSPAIPAVAPAAAAPVSPTPQNIFGTAGRGISALLKPEGRTAFMDALGGGLSKSAVFMGAMDALTPQAKALPTGAAEEDLVYIHGGRNPQYGTGRDQPYYLPGQYYKRTDRGLVPYNPFQLAPGYGQPPAMPQRGFGPRGRGFADGGAVQGPINISPFAAPTNDPNVLATRAYIEELNRRVRAPITLPSGGDTSGRGGLGSFGGAGLPITDGVGGGGVGGAAGPSTGDIVGGIASSYLINKGIGKGIDYLRDQFTTDPTIKRAQETPVTDDLQGVDLTKLPATQAALAALNPYNVPAPQFTVGVEEILDAQQPVELNADLQAKTQVGGDLSKPLSSYLSGASAVGSGLAGLAGLGKAASIAIELPVYDALGNLIGFSSAPGAAAAGAGAAAGGAGAAGAGAGGAGGAGAAGQAGLGSLQTKIIPGLQTALGLYEAYKGIESGKEGRAALGGLSAGLGAGTLAGYSGLAALGPIGLGAAAIAALGASLVKTDEMGASSLRNYWSAVEQGRGFGQAPADELARGFINFYRTNKNQFPGQGKYGRKGNEDFLYDMTQVINDAVKSGKVSKDVDAPTMFKEVVQPWMDSFGFEQNINADTKRVQDFMMTDLIYNFMQGKPISNAQVKNDSKYKIVSERPVYAGTAPAQETKQPEFQNIPAAAAAIRQAMEARSPFAAPEEREMIMPVGQDVPIAPPLTREQRDALVSINTPAPNQRVAAPYVPPDALTDLSIPGNIEPVQEFVGTPYMPEMAYGPPTDVTNQYPGVYGPTTTFSDLIAAETYDPTAGRQPVERPVFSGGDQMQYAPPSPFEAPSYVPREEPAYITPQPQYSAPAYEEPVYIPREEPAFINPYAEERFMYAPESGEYAFAAGGAIGEDYNFGFAQGGRPMEYRAGGKFLQGPGDGMSDDIKANIDGRQEARLADGEFVIPADVVSHLGNGSSNAGAKKLHQMMARVRQARTGRKKQAPAVKMDRYLPA